ncbi:hypothetical protein ABEF95_010744 [Exophiala dermatitidis]
MDESDGGPSRPEVPATTPITTSISQTSPKSSAAASSAASTTVTTPEQSPGADDDIWDISSEYHDDAQHQQQQLHRTNSLSHNGHGDTPGDDGPRPQRGEILSDIPSLRRQHMTDGYREGLAVGKARVMQAGFDAGYPFGVEIGLRVGKVLGVLEGIVAAVSAAGGGATSTSSSTTTTTIATATAGSRSSSHSKNTGMRIGVSSDDELAVGVGSKIELTESPSDRGRSSTGSIGLDVQFVRSLLDRAKGELKISELLKMLDDAKIARLEETGTDTKAAAETTLPAAGEEEPPAARETNESKAAGASTGLAGQEQARQEGETPQETQSPAPAPASEDAASVAGNNQHDQNNSNISIPVLPPEIEAVIARWECLVLGSLN